MFSGSGQGKLLFCTDQGRIVDRFVASARDTVPPTLSLTMLSVVQAFRFGRTHWFLSRVSGLGT